MPRHRLEIADWVAGWRKRRPKLVVLLLDREEARELAQAVSAEDWDVKQQHFERRRERIEQGPRWEERGGHIIPRYD